jgi:hypothetical protein
MESGVVTSFCEGEDDVDVEERLGCDEAGGEDSRLWRKERSSLSACCSRLSGCDEGGGVGGVAWVCEDGSCACGSSFLLGAEDDHDHQPMINDVDVDLISGRFQL